jgi:hypothetical protein
MIGQHPELAGLPELKLFCCATIGELEDSLPEYWIRRGVTHRSPGLVRAIAHLEFGDQTLQSLSSARAWLEARRHWSGAEVLDALQTRLSPLTIVEKSPDNVLSDEALERMSSAYPRARYLHLTRHPLTTQRSIQEHRARTVPEHPQHDEPMYSIASWYSIHRRLFHFGAELPPQRYMRVRAEDVLNDSERQLCKIAAWFGVSTDACAIEAMKHPEASPFASVGGGNDPGFLSNPIPRAAELPLSLDPPEGWDAEPEVWEMVKELASLLDYCAGEEPVDARECE